MDLGIVMKVKMLYDVMIAKMPYGEEANELDL